MTIAVVLNDCAAAEETAPISVRWKPTHHGNAANWRYSYEAMAKSLPAPLSSIQQDWLEIFGALYAVDRVSRRGPRWIRHIHAYIPVREVSHWQSATDDLRDLWNRLTGDRLDCSFVGESSPLPPPRTDREVPTDAAGVALFSGGIDSFTAVAQAYSRRENLATVAHLSSPAVINAIKALLARMPDLPRPAPLPVMAQNGSNSGLVTDESQRARSLLYIASAVLAAQSLGLDRVIVGENGILAVHEPETEARVPSLATRTAHPQVLRAMEVFSRGYLGSAVQIVNPLEKLTKAEVVQLAASIGHQDAIVDTVSCWQISRNALHCGYCIPCLQRRVATEMASVADSHYARNPWDEVGGTGQSGEAEVDNLVHLIQLAQQISEADDVAIELQRPGLIGVGGSLSDKERIELHRRWASEVLHVAAGHQRSRALM